MAIKREVIAEGVALSTHDDRPGHLCVTVHDGTGVVPQFRRVLTPVEVDKLVLHALSMTKPEDLDPISEGDYEGAVAAVRVWQGTRAFRESARQRDAERDAVMGEAGYWSLTYAEAGPAIQFLVDRLIEARKVGQQ